MRANEFLNEAGLEQSELAKHGGKYLKTLLTLASEGPVEVSPEKRSKYMRYQPLQQQEHLYLLSQNLAISILQLINLNKNTAHGVHYTRALNLQH